MLILYSACFALVVDVSFDTHQANPSYVLDINSTIESKQHVMDYQDGEMIKDKDISITVKEKIDSFELRSDLEFVDCDDVRVIENLSREMDDRDISYNCSSISITPTKGNDSSERSDNKHVNYFILPKAPLSGSTPSGISSADRNDSSRISKCAVGKGEYADSLHTILDDLENCLDLSCEIGNSKKYCKSNLSFSSTFSSNKETCTFPEPDSSLLGLMYSAGDDLDEEFEAFVDCKTENVSNESPATPTLKFNVPHAVDSTLMTKKRSSSEFCKPKTSNSPLGSRCNQELVGFSKVHNHAPSLTPLYNTSVTPSPQLILPSLKDPPKTNFAYLNRSGNLSPFIQSVAHKYHIFDTPKLESDGAIPIGTKEQRDDSDHDYEDIATVKEILQREDSKDNYHKGTYQVNNMKDEINKMVNSYVYDVLGTAYAPKSLNDGFVEEVLESIEEGTLLSMTQKSDSVLFESDYDGDVFDDDSVAVCIDENSIRLISSVSKDEVIDRDALIDKFSDEPSVLMCMTGRDSPIIDTDVKFTPEDHLVCEGPRLSTEQRFQNINSPLRLCNDIRESDDTLGCTDEVCVGFVSKPKLVQSGLSRQTSSFCRISFNDDAPSFWYKKDVNESPVKVGYAQASRAKSPKRTISEIKDRVPSLFMLAERVYLDDFKGKVEAFKAENSHLVMLKSSRSPFESQIIDTDRSPAKKKRKKCLSDNALASCTKQVNLNYNENAIQDTSVPVNIGSYPVEESGTVDTFFGSKIDTPQYVGFQPASKVLLQQLKAQKMSEEKEESKRKSSLKENSNNSALKNTTHLATEVSQCNPYCCRSEADYLLVTGTSEEDAKFAIDCSEKRRRRFFNGKLKPKAMDCPVKLLSYKKLMDNDNCVANPCNDSFEYCHRIADNAIESVTVFAERTNFIPSKFSHNMPTEKIEMIGMPGNDDLASNECLESENGWQKKQKEEQDTMGREPFSFFDEGYNLKGNKRSVSTPVDHKTKRHEDCLKDPVDQWTLFDTIENEETTDRFIYQDITDKHDEKHVEKQNMIDGMQSGSSQSAKIHTSSNLNEVSSDVEEGNSIRESFTALEGALQKHKHATDRLSYGDGDLEDLIKTRDDLYGALSETLNICSVSIRKSRELQCRKGLLESTNESGYAAEDNGEVENDSSDVTPDPDTLLKDLQCIDLSDTPHYAEENGEMKVFLKKALESLDNMLVDSFDSFEDSPKMNVDMISSIGIQTDCDDFESESPLADFVETKDASSMTVFGTSCQLNEPCDSFVERIMSPGEIDISLKNDFSDETIEVLDDSVLNIVGRQCKLHDADNTSNCSSYPSQPLLEEGESQNDPNSPNIQSSVFEPFMFKIKITNTDRPCQYDEAFTVDGTTKNHGRQSCSSISSQAVKIDVNPDCGLPQSPLHDFINNEEHLIQHVANAFYRENNCSLLPYKMNPSYESALIESDPGIFSESNEIISSSRHRQAQANIAPLNIVQAEVGNSPVSFRHAEFGFDNPLWKSSPVLSEGQLYTDSSECGDMFDIDPVCEDPLLDSQQTYTHLVNSSDKENIKPEEQDYSVEFYLKEAHGF